MKSLVALALAGLTLSPGPGAVLAAEQGAPQYTIMHPDRETMLKWFQAHDTMAKAPMALAPDVPLPGGSLTLLTNLTYTPSQRNQGACGNCWCWAGHGCMEILLNTQNGVSARLSVQYMNSCENAAIGMTCCSGGWLSDVALFYSTPGYQQALPWANPGANWQDGDASCDTPCGSITTAPNYPVKAISAVSISTYGVGQAQAIANIKAILNQHKPVAFAFFLAEGSDWTTFDNAWSSQPESTTVDFDYACGHTWNSGGGGHEVVCVGYNDDNPANPYWIMVNSWGTTANRPNGIFHVSMTNNYNCTFNNGGTYTSYYWEYLNVTYAVSPVFSSILAAPSYAKSGAPVTITFAASETLSGNPAVTVNAHAASYVSNSGNNYTYAYTVQASDADGPAALVIAGTDLWNNSGATTNTTALWVENAPPTFGGITALPSLAKAGAGVTLWCVASQALAAYPVVTVNANAASYVARSGTTNYTYSYVIQNSDPVGDATIVISGTDLAGNSGSTTNTTALVVDTTAPVIAVQPDSQTAILGSNVTFQVTAVGTMPLAYQWRCNGTNLTGAAGSALSLTNVQEVQAGTYSVLVTNDYGALLSTDAWLTELDPWIVGQPQNQFVTAGTPATFGVSAVGTPPLSYQWFKEGSPLVDGTNISGAHTPGLTVAQAQAGDVGSYSVTVSNLYGLVASSNATLSGAFLPVLLTQPASQTVLAGSVVSFMATAAGGGNPMTFQWQRAGANLVDGGKLSGSATASLTVSNVQAGDMGGYSVVVSNAYGGVASSNALLTVSPLLGWGRDDYSQADIPAGLTNVTGIAAGFYHSLALRADGTVAAWGAGTTGSGTSPDYGQALVPAGLSNVLGIAAGAFHNLALQPEGTVAAWGAGTTNTGASPYYGQAVVPGGLTNAVAVAAGYYHSLALTAGGTVVGWGYNKYGQTNSPVGLTNAVAIACGAYHSLALRADGTVVAWGAGTNLGSAPNYGQALVPGGLTGVVALAAGGYHSLALKADGTVVAWGAGTTNTGVIPNYGQAMVPVGLTNVVAVACGFYHGLALQADGTVVSWGAGTTSTGSSPNYGQAMLPAGLANGIRLAGGGYHTLVLEGDGRPSVTTQPVSQSAPAGATVVYTAMAVGLRPMSCQWQRNGTNVGGATASTLTLANVQCSDAGAYTLLFSNSLGSTASRAAGLTISDGTPPTITCPSDVVVSANSGCAATNVALGTPATGDNCGVAGVTNNGPATYPLGTNLVTWTVWDASGNSNSCVQRVIVWDTTPPVLACATNKTVADGSTWNFDPPVASGACGGTNVTVTLAGVVTNGAWPEVITATWVAVDAYGNTNTCSQSVTNVTAAAPVADFTGDPTNGIAPLAVTFTNRSSGATDYAWDFGDGQTSTNANPLNRYTNAGTFSVSLSAIGPGGTNELTLTNYVVVTSIIPPPQLAVGPLNLDFGLVATGATAQASFVVSNAGTATLLGSATVDTPFVILSGTPFALDPLGSTNLILSFAPSAPGVFSNLVVFTSNGGSSTNPITGRALGTVSLRSQGAIGADFVFSFDTDTGFTYVVQYKDDLNDPAWQVLQTVTGDGTTQTVTNVMAAGLQRFYRLSVE